MNYALIMNNKCIIYSVKWDNNNIDSLSNYNGILYSIGFKNRNFDVYINCDKKSYDIILNIIQQEKWNFLLENVYFNIHDNMINYHLWSIKTFIDNYDKYELFGFYNSYYELGEDFFSILCDYKYGIYTRCNYFHDKILFCNGEIGYLDVDLFIINKKYLYTNIKKLKNVIDQLCIFKYNLHDIKMYIYDFLYCEDFYKNNCLYFNNLDLNTQYNEKYNFYKNTLPYIEYKNTKWFWYYYNIKDSIYYNKIDNTYKIKNIIYYIYKHQNYIISNYNLETQHPKLKHMFLQIKRYMLNYIDNLDLKCYDTIT